MARTKEFDEIAVLGKAVQLFWCKGYHGTSAQDLVDVLGISRSSLYDTFGDKRTLFIKALQNYRATAATALIDMIDTSSDIEKTIADIFRMVVKESLEDKLLKGCFIVNTTIEIAPHDQEVAQIIKQNMNDIEQAFLKAIQKGQDKGVFSTHQSAQALARFIFNNISGLRVAAKANAEKEILEDVMQVTLSILQK